MSPRQALGLGLGSQLVLEMRLSPRQILGILGLLVSVPSPGFRGLGLQFEAGSLVCLFLCHVLHFVVWARNLRLGCIRAVALDGFLRTWHSPRGAHPEIHRVVSPMPHARLPPANARYLPQHSIVLGRITTMRRLRRTSQLGRRKDAGKTSRAHLGILYFKER